MMQINSHLHYIFKKIESLIPKFLNYELKFTFVEFKRFIDIRIVETLNPAVMSNSQLKRKKESGNKLKGLKM